jgi:archaellum component FlaD/FlaE
MRVLEELLDDELVESGFGGFGGLPPFEDELDEEELEEEDRLEEELDDDRDDELDEADDELEDDESDEELLDETEELDEDANDDEELDKDEVEEDELVSANVLTGVGSLGKPQPPRTDPTTAAAGTDVSKSRKSRRRWVSAVSVVGAPVGVEACCLRRSSGMPEFPDTT